ncbi:MAG: glycosyltransferase family 2 protein [Anaerolineae bacterium]
MPDLSVVIVNYNTKPQLQACLNSLLRHQGELALEIIVVDNGSVDGSQAMVRAHAPQVTLIEPGYNSWFTGGNNIGTRSANGDFVWILNPDTVVQAGTMQTMLAYLRQHEPVGAVTCLMQFPDGREQPTCSMTPRYVDLLLGYTFIGALLSGWRDSRRATMFYKGWERDSVKSVEVAPDSNLMARRELLLAIGIFDEALKLYFTEDDICRRILETGYDVRFLPDALLLHHEHASVEQVQRLASQVYFDDLLIFCKTYYGTVSAWLLNALVIPTRWAMGWVQQWRGEKKALSS